MRHISLLVLVIFGVNTLSGQLIDSLDVIADIHYSGGPDKHFLNLGTNGFLLYGPKSGNPKKKNYSIDEFVIQQYDTNYKAINTIISLDFKCVLPTVRRNDEYVYFLFEPYLAQTSRMELLKYNILTHQYQLFAINNNWKHPIHIDFSATSDFLYITHDDQNGGLAPIKKFEYINYTSASGKLTPVDLRLENGYVLSNVIFIWNSFNSDSIISTPFLQVMVKV